MEFGLGCNYWASHAGIYMWRNWDKAVVESDLQKLSQCGIKVLRVFPLWSDFQPLTYVKGNGYYEIRNGDIALDRSTPEGLAGVDPVMIQRFEEFVLLAKQYDMQLIVPLITGWMSGRMFFPSAFESRNPISDYETIKWELRFVRYFVERFKGFDNIAAWEAGNETNVMSFADEGWKQGNYYVWLSNIAGAIRSADPSRPVIAGIHGLSIEGNLGITIAEVGEVCDVLTVHPYAPFVPHCYVDGYTTMRSKLHATTESILYSQISGKPCLCEEIGHLGNSLGCDETVAKYLRANLYIVCRRIACTGHIACNPQGYGHIYPLALQRIELFLSKTNLQAPAVKHIHIGTSLSRNQLYIVECVSSILTCRRIFLKLIKGNSAHKGTVFTVIGVHT